MLKKRNRMWLNSIGKASKAQQTRTGKMLKAMLTAPRPAKKSSQAPPYVQRCWKWYDAAPQRGGDIAMIAGMVRETITNTRSMRARFMSAAFRRVGGDKLRFNPKGSDVGKLMLAFFSRQRRTC